MSYACLFVLVGENALITVITRKKILTIITLLQFVSSEHKKWCSLSFAVDGVDDVPTHVGEGACIKTSSSLCIIKFTEDDNSSLSLR